MNLYLDTSALVKRYIAEEGSQEVRGWIREAAIVGTVLITRAETTAAFSRLFRVCAINSDEYDSALQQFRKEWAEYQRIPITESLVSKADYLACEYGLRGYDSVHLAAALFWQDMLGLPVTLAVFDKQLAEAAQASTLAVFPNK